MWAVNKGAVHALLEIWNQNSNIVIYEKCCSYLSFSIFTKKNKGHIGSLLKSDCMRPCRCNPKIWSVTKAEKAITLIPNSIERFEKATHGEAKAALIQIKAIPWLTLVSDTSISWINMDGYTYRKQAIASPLKDKKNSKKAVISRP